jgi:hypothetical protein
MPGRMPDTQTKGHYHNCATVVFYEERAKG